MNTRPSRCQCLASCPHEALKGEAFCADHMKFCPRRAPLSGYEPEYNPGLWNLDKAIRLTHNCFIYALNIIDPRQIKKCKEDPDCDVPFPQPGSVSGWPRFSDKDPKTCPNMIARLLGDNPSLLPSAFELKCPKGTSKIALIVDEDEDYHFLRQDKPKEDDSSPAKLGSAQHQGIARGDKGIGYFSQKSGAMPVKDVDARGHKIFDVQLANHNFSRGEKDPLNYDRFCGYFCVPRDKALYVKSGGGKGKGKVKKYRFTRRR
jgi:hypothetical protein